MAFLRKWNSISQQRNEKIRFYTFLCFFLKLRRIFHLKSITMNFTLHLYWIQLENA